MKAWHIIGGGALLGAAILLSSKKSQAELPPIPDPPNTPVVPFTGPPKLTAHLSDTFLREVDALAASYRARGAGVKAEDLFSVFLGESPWAGKNINPAAISSTGCVGINQICDLKAVGWGGTKEQYRALLAEEQLPYTDRYFKKAMGAKPWSAMRNVGDLYLLNFAPGYVGSAPTAVIYKNGDWQYSGNRSLDVNNKGYIEVADMARYMNKVVSRNPVFWGELMGRLASVRSQGST